MSKEQTKGKCDHPVWNRKFGCNHCNKMRIKEEYKKSVDAKFEGLSPHPRRNY